MSQTSNILVPPWGESWERGNFILIRERGGEGAKEKS